MDRKQCLNGCGFFGSEAFGGYCSVCHKTLTDGGTDTTTQPKPKSQAGPARCLDGCGFFGSPVTEGYCSSCYKAHTPSTLPSSAPTSSPPMERTNGVNYSNAPLSCLTVDAQTLLGFVRQAGQLRRPVLPRPAKQSLDDQKAEDSEPTAQALPKKTKKKKVRCALCRKKVKLTLQFECRCGKVYCPKHRAPMEHDCTYDHFKVHQDHIAKTNPDARFEKLGGDADVEFLRGSPPKRSPSSGSAA